MSIKHELIPKRRFKEFENADAWEQRKLGEIVLSEIKGSAKAEMIGGDTPYLETNYLNGGECLFVDSENNVDTDDVIVLWDGSQAGTVYHGFSGALGSTFKAYKTKCLGLFIFQQLKKNQQTIYDKYRTPNIPHVIKTFKDEYDVMLTSEEEQNEIGRYFQQIDNLITLHQRKLSKLRILKSAYLSEIIPEEGKLNPKRRFPGFTEDWEKKKISDMFKVTRGQVLSMSLTSPIKDETNKYPVYSSQTKNDGLMGYYSEYLFDTAITWTTDGANAGTVNFREGKFFSTNVNGVLLSNDGYCNKAMSEILNLVTYKYVSKVGNPKLMNNVMEEIIISVPKDKNEMKIISDFLMTFDKRIIYLEEKIKKLEDLKRSYLNEMFV